ncbi:MAG: FtsQ-type POTRA domain-containing protein [Erysipelotrichaceae bacterium]|nr:FtsQ-type POTRA domain-containing protein [Erysipelotrichaceae bacterium]
MEEVNQEILEPREEYQQEVEAGINIIRQKVDLEKAKKKLIARKKVYSILLLAGIIGFIGLMFFVYLLTPASNVRSVKILNNNYLSDEYIQELTGISTKSEYVLLFPGLKAYKASRSPLINNVKITRGPSKTVIIDVEENPIMGYRFKDNMELVLGDGSIIKFDQKYVKGITILPLFMNVKDEKVAQVATQMNRLDFDTVSRIAEVRDFSMSYDSDMVKFVMDDGYEVYTSLDGIPLLVNYLDIITTTTSPNRCVYLDYDHNNAIVRNCREIERIADKTPEEEAQQNQSERQESEQTEQQEAPAEGE